MFLKRPLGTESGKFRERCRPNNYDPLPWTQYSSTFVRTCHHNHEKIIHLSRLCKVINWKLWGRWVICVSYSSTLLSWSATISVADITISHDDVIKRKHFPRYWPFSRGIHRLPVNSPHKGQWRGALMFSLICAWINRWEHHRETGDLRRHRAHYDVIVMSLNLVSMTQRRTATRYIVYVNRFTQCIT